MSSDKTAGKGGFKGLSHSFVLGAVALVFLATGYQTALFINRASMMRVLSEERDTVYVYEDSGGTAVERDDGRDTGGRYDAGTAKERHNAENAGKRNNITGKKSDCSGKRASNGYASNSEGEYAKAKIREAYSPRSYESFPFDPNTVSVADLQRLGFTLKQAESIDRYRQKGGHFRRSADFARSYVVADSVFARLEPFISIPKINLNSADSAAFMSLPGIGKYFASKMVSYRKSLGGYSYKEQLMEIYHFDEEKFAALEDLIEVGDSEAYPLWTLPEDSLRLHPYIGSYSAHGIAVFRANNPKSEWTVSALDKAGILRSDLAPKLSRCRIAMP